MRISLDRGARRLHSLVGPRRIWRHTYGRPHSNFCPSHSPTVPAPPVEKTNVRSGGPAELLFRSSHVPVEKSKVPTVSTQSPTIPAPPIEKANARSSGPAELLFRSSHVPVEKLKVPTVSTPSPSQSPTMPAPPVEKTNVRSGGPAELPFRSSTFLGARTRSGPVELVGPAAPHPVSGQRRETRSRSLPPSGQRARPQRSPLAR